MSGTDQERQGVAALTDLFEEYYERITRYIAVRVGNRADAEELASDVFVRAVENIGSFQWRGVPLQAWLYRIAHNVAVDHLRRSSRRKSGPLDEATAVASPGRSRTGGVPWYGTGGVAQSYGGFDRCAEGDHHSALLRRPDLGGNGGPS